MISPVVLITASAVVGSGLTTLFTAVNERMRSMTRERISLRAGEDSPLTRERIAEIDTQLDWLLDRHRLISRAVQLSYATPFVLTLSVIVIAIGVGTQNEGVGIAADVLVVAGALTLLAGLWYAARSSVNSERAIEYEVKRVRSLLRSGLSHVGNGPLAGPVRAGTAGRVLARIVVHLGLPTPTGLRPSGSPRGQVALAVLDRCPLARPRHPVLAYRPPCARCLLPRPPRPMFDPLLLVKWSGLHIWRWPGVIRADGGRVHRLSRP
jgi:hypothetical protein